MKAVFKNTDLFHDMVLSLRLDTLDELRTMIQYILKKEIAFCWKDGEDRILFWHLLGQDCEKRQPINIIERNYFDVLKKLK